VRICVLTRMENAVCRIRKRERLSQRSQAGPTHGPAAQDATAAGLDARNGHSGPGPNLGGLLSFPAGFCWPPRAGAVVSRVRPAVVGFTKVLVSQAGPAAEQAVSGCLAGSITDVASVSVT
jgi:hypothetical protein